MRALIRAVAIADADVDELIVLAGYDASLDRLSNKSPFIVGTYDDVRNVFTEYLQAAHGLPPEDALSHVRAKWVDYDVCSLNVRTTCDLLTLFEFLWTNHI